MILRCFQSCMFAPMVRDRKYPSKILLTGEYLVLRGGLGFAIPWPRYTAEWTQSPQHEYPLAETFVDFICNQAELARELDINRLKKDLSEGWYLSTNIPFGYGLGSSGTVCAALLDHYQFSPQRTLEATHALLKSIESYFHGSSSGLDPMVSYYARPVLLKTATCTLMDPLHPGILNETNVALVDSGIQRKTQELVRGFKLDCEDPDFVKRAETLSESNDRLLDALISNHPEHVKIYWRQISSLSRRLFQRMIPDTIAPFWDEGLASESFYCKLCGAGGGGLFLVYYTDRSQLLEQIKKYRLRLFDFL